MGGTPGNSYLNIAGGAVDINANFNPNTAVGNVPGAAGFLSMTSGSLDSSEGEFHLGQAAGAYGVLDFSGGTITVGEVNAGDAYFFVGAGGEGVLNMKGGTINDNAQEFSIANTAGGVGVANVSGGTLNDSKGLHVGDRGTATLNISGTVTVNAGAMLGGNGLIGRQVSLAAGATLAPGSNGFGTLTITNDLDLNNGDTLAFQRGTVGSPVTFTGDLTLGGTLNLTAIASFGLGTYPLFTYGGALSVGTVTMGTAPAGYNYTVDASVAGLVQVIVTAPRFGLLQARANGLVFSGSGGTPNASYYVLTTTNLALPLRNWTPLLTKQFDASGNFTVTNALAPCSRQQFYRLVVP